MRCSSAVVLSTLAVGQAAAANLHNRHSSFHARREASKREANNAVNWDAVAYDLKDVKWDEINWSSVFASSQAAAPTPTPQAQKPSPVAASPTPEAKKPTPSPVVQVAAKPVESSKAAAPSPKVETNNVISDIVSDVFAGVASIANAIGAQTGVNSKTNNGGIWIGTDSDWQMEVTNGGSKQAVFYCWKANGFSGMSINKNVPEISVGLKPGQKVDLSFAAGVPAACAPATDSSKLALFGGLHETWAEVTFGKDGAFDVSRNVNMRGCNISMKGSKCTSDMNTCVFKCKDTSVESCETGYTLDNCDASNGGGGGYDPVMAGVGGGCAMGSSGEKIKVSFS
ncbi:hypothetical protein FB567DRAFT_479596 [Paraphoma chrysanthemicola]|uniref:Effector 5 n=1 Tax=Paraphoma chrysanthemicola TaxID=798071 RepID=A0A8K0QXU7_9PLEO|nr:hypothetical protein FB567DRAFT_479596 [Paraphoma chrysanthemicola]